MPLMLNLLERSLLVTLNQGPGPILDLWSAIAFRAVMAADRLGVFEMLISGPATPADLARRLGADPRGLDILIEALVPLGYLERKDAGYANSAMTEKWLTSQAKANFAPYMRFWDDVMLELWSTLANSIREGEPAVNLYKWIEDKPETSRHFQEGMVAIAGLVQDEIAGKLVFLNGGGRILDVGGGHGAYSIALCRRYPGVSATLFDSPQALATGRVQVERAELGNRIEFVEGNFLTDPLPGGFATVLLFNIVHGFSSVENKALVAKVAGALNPGGRMVVIEQLAESGGKGASHAINRLLALSYFQTLGGQVYAFGDLAGWMQQAGLGQIQRIDFRRTAGSSLIMGVK